MLGETLSDPHGVENGGSMKGMGLLPMETVFAEKKTRTRVQGHFGQLSGVFAPLPVRRSRAMRSIWRKYPEGECRNSHEDHRQRQR